jgi:uncharacterized protein (TIGR00255 family)
MLKSMTGYGKATCIYKHKNITVELRSVNSKQFDINIRMPGFYKEKELEIRNDIGRQVERGKVDFYITVEQLEPDKPVTINQSIVKEYFNQLKTIAEELNVTVNEQLLLSTLRLPETLKTESQSLSNEEWNSLNACIQQALASFVVFRVQEGKVLASDIIKRVSLIESYLSEIKQFEKPRIDRIRERLDKNLNEFLPAASIDANRFEQEIIYFLEKLDVTEEKVRLKNHCTYFIKTIEEEASTGRKLGFIAQEMGREINTLGSKANDSEIQKLVVMMKDELEKIKEQLMNVL